MANWTLSQYEALTEAIALGATTVQYSDRTVTFRSLDQMLALQKQMERKLFPNQFDPSSLRIKMTYDKDL